METRKSKKFRTKIVLEAGNGVRHIVELSGPKGAVAHIADMVSFGLEAKAAGLTREGIEMARREAMRQLGVRIHEGN